MQPVVVGLDAECLDFQFYAGGILTTGQCFHEVNHHALAVGFDTDGSQQFWRVKNSYGDSWGENGYIRIGKDDGHDKEGGTIGILTQAIYPTV